MTERLIEPADYTPEILVSIARIKNRMQQTLVTFTDNDIRVFEHEGTIYILGNPVLGQEPIFDELGNFLEMIPLYNITLIHDRDWLKTEHADNSIRFIAKVPRLRVMRPDLCDRIYDDRQGMAGTWQA